MEKMNAMNAVMNPEVRDLSRSATFETLMAVLSPLVRKSRTP